MKKIFYITLSLLMVFGLTSCENWLDVNTNPDSPNNNSVSPEMRLPWMQYHHMYAYSSASVRSAGAYGVLTASSSHIKNFSTWELAAGTGTTFYQCWLTFCGNNIPDMIRKAEEIGAYHYVGAALVIKSMGFSMLADMFGEFPYTEALTSSLSPKYDTGDVIYEGCLADLDKAIEYFGMQQTGGMALSVGDTWCGGDVNKWIKLCHGLKARMLSNLSKTDKYDMEAILAEIEQGPKSNADDVRMIHANIQAATEGNYLGDMYGPSVIWDVAAWGASQRLQKFYVDMLTNFKGSGVEDPRADKLIPSAMYQVKLSSDGQRIVDFKWRRDRGVNIAGPEKGWKKDRFSGVNSIQTSYCLATEDTTNKYSHKDIVDKYVSVDAFKSNIQEFYGDGATVADANDTVKVTFHPGAVYSASPLLVRAEDVRYVQYRADCMGETQGVAVNDMNCYYAGENNEHSDNFRQLGFVQGTGAFYSRPDSDTDIMTYAEMCFIKAEVLFRKGDKAGAYNAYKDGILAHFSRMNEKLASWTGIGCGTTAKGFDVSFAYSPIPQSDIDAYMKSAAVAQNSGELEMSDIMMQKLIAMGYNYQNWNDVRRFNYFSDNLGFGVVYQGMQRAAYKTSTSDNYSTDVNSDQYYLRRCMLPTLETNYNSSNCIEIVEQYKQYGIEGPTDLAILSIPVWWDWTK